MKVILHTADGKEQPGVIDDMRAYASCVTLSGCGATRVFFAMYLHDPQGITHYQEVASAEVANKEP